MAALSSGIIYLTAAVIAVPIFKKLKLGSILGYLIAGIIIGPSLLGLVDDPEQILHFAELGVIFLLFIIGLELNPSKLWQMRNSIMFTGGGQLITTSIILIVTLLFGFSMSFSASLTIALALALSSTAFAIQLMSEQHILKTPPGQRGFSILLMQDLAVIPILLLVESLAVSDTSSGLPWWVSALAVLAVLVIGRYAINPFLRLVSRSGSEEVFTAAALLIVIATAAAMQAAGLSMGLGTFIAGILLANSSFRHQLETEVNPFKGLLLGLFFIAIGMNMNLQLLIEDPLFIIAMAIGLVIIKTIVIFAILKAAKQTKTDSIRIGLMLSQGGEFAFVVMTQAVAGNIVSTDIAASVNLIVGLSMALTSPLIILHGLWFSSKHCPPVYDDATQVHEPEIMIAGFGRFAQITARILAANKIPFVGLDKDAEHIEFIKVFGSQAFYGDATRLDLLKRAGIEHVKVLFITVNDNYAIEIVKQVKAHYPHIKIIARVENRFTIHTLHELGVDSCVREVFASGLEAAEKVLEAYGVDDIRAAHLIKLFKDHDSALLQDALDNNLDLKSIIEKSEEERKNLELLFQQDKQL